MLAVSLTHMTFIWLRELPWVPNWLRVFYFCFVLLMTEYWIFKYFFHLMKGYFLFYPVNILNDSDLFIKPSLNTQNKFHLFLIYYPFDILLDFIWQYIFEDFCISVHEAYWSIDFCSNLCLVLVSGYCWPQIFSKRVL